MSQQSELKPQSSPFGAQGFDAVLLEILWTRLVSIVNEAAAALMRTSFSTLVREALDFSCIVADAHGQGLAQPPNSIPSFIGTLPATVRHFIAEFSVASMQPGDVFITNDPWKGTGHLADVSVCKPIFLDGQVVGFAASVAHAPDMGGRTGSSESRDVFEEGFQIPPMHMCRAGQPDATFFKLLSANVREPDEVVGDLWAQVSALELIEKRVVTLMREAGLTTLTELAREIHDRSERAMRQAIRELPDGVYRYETQTDGMTQPIKIKIAITVKDDTIVVDFAGTSPQVDRALNSALCYTQAYTMYGLKCLLSPDVPNNAGSFRPIEIRAPEGSLVNHRFPNSGCSRALVGHYLPFLVLSALAPAVPDRVIAGSGSPVWSVLMRGVDQRNRAFADKYFYNGGMGASSERPGMSAMSWPTNLSITQTEVVEHSVPCEVRYKRLRTGSGGIGRNAGGMGQDILFESVSDKPMLLIFMAERTRIPAPGLQGGGDGEVGAVLLDGQPIDPKVQHVLPAGSTVLLRTPGGGGFGAPPSGQDSHPQSGKDRSH